MKIRVAAVQASPAFLDLHGTLERLEHWGRRAAADGAKIIAFPETWLPGYPAWNDSSPEAGIWNHEGEKDVFARLFENSLCVPSAECSRLGNLAKELGVTLVVGANERSGRTLYNTLLTFTPDGALANHHRKLVPTYTERIVWGYGDAEGLRAVDASGVKVGALVCWEHWMPLTRQAMHDAQEQVHVAAWPTVHEMHQVASRHYAFEGRCFVIACGSMLHASQMPPELPALPSHAARNEGWLLRGGSAIIAPDGRYLAGPVYDEETMIAAECDLTEIARESQALDVSGHYSRPDVFTFDIRADRPRRTRPI